MWERRGQPRREPHDRRTDPPRFRTGEPRGIDALDQPWHQSGEHGWVHRPDIFDADYEAVDPAHLPLERVQPVELHPYPLVELRPLDELELAAKRRGIIGAHPIMVLARPAQHDVRVDGYPLGLALGEIARDRVVGKAHSWLAPQPVADDGPVAAV